MNENPLDKIQSYYDDLTPNERNIAVQIINDPLMTATQTIDLVAQKYGTSKAALVRFAKHIGYKGYAEFKYDMSRFLVSHNAEAASQDENESPVLAITKAYSDYILDIPKFCLEEQFLHAADLFLHARKVKIFGRNRTYSSARQLRLRLSRMGYDAEATDDPVLMGDICDSVADQDLVIIFTTNNNSRYEEIAPTVHDNGGKLICVTMNQDISFKNLCDEYIVLPRISRSSRMSFLDDQVLNFVWIEIFLNVLAEKAGAEKK